MASWSLVSAPWMAVRRARLGLDRLARNFRQPKNHAWASNQASQQWGILQGQRYPLAQPSAGVFEEGSDEYTAEVPAIAHVPRNSSETLAHLVAEGNYEEADRIRMELLLIGMEIKLDRVYEKAAKNVFLWPNPQNHVATFSDWFSLIPNACDSTPRSFRDICSFLFASPTTNMPLIMAFGLICASKGYADFVREHVTPIVVRFGSPAVTEEWLRNIDTNASRSLRKANPAMAATSHTQPHHTNISPPHSVTVGSTSTDLYSSINSSVFEDEDAEYKSIIAVAGMAHSPHTTFESLERLVVEGDYEAAEGVRRELLDLGMIIPPSEVYLKAVKAVLRRPLLQNRVSAFEDWFSLLPPANSTLSLTGVRRSLFASPATNMPLIIRFGLMSASKGYFDQIAAQIIPVVLRFNNTSVSTLFLQQLEAEVTQWVMKRSYASLEISRAIKRIRERAIRTYAEAGHLDTAVKIITGNGTQPVVVSLFTCNFLLRRLQLKVANDKSASPGIQLVQDLRSQWYESPHTVDPHPAEAVVTAETLEVPDEVVELVKKARYEKAAALRDELFAAGVAIKPHSLYEEAAKSVLERPDVADRVEAFSGWFSMVPDAHYMGVKTFSSIRNILFASPLQNLPIIMRFGLLCASKGYGDIVHRDVIPAVIRFSDLEAAAQYVHDFESKATQYMKVHYPGREAEHALKGFRGLATRVYCQVGRLDDAVNMLRADVDQRNRMSLATYNILLDELQAKQPKSAEDYENIKFVRRHRDLMMYSHHSGVNNLVETAEEAQLSTAWTSARPLPSNARLASDLRFLLRFIKRSVASALPPHPFTLVDFIEQYLETGRTKALKLLRQKALRSSYRNAALWIFAEMIYYRRLRLDQLVIATFVDHFYLSGVPRGDLLMAYRQHTDNRPNQLLPNRGKIWPSAEHIALVWHSMVSMTRGPVALEALYPKLLESVREGATRDKSNIETAPLAEDSSVLLQPPIQQRFNPACFTPFIRMFAFRSGPVRAQAVLSDMMKLGITPNVYHFTVLAGEFAARREDRKAILILDRMEKGLADVESASAPSDLPTPNIVMYTNLMRGFCNARSLEGAEEVERRMMKNLEYRPGINPYTDLAYSLLNELRRDLEQERAQQARRRRGSQNIWV